MIGITNIQALRGALFGLLLLAAWSPVTAAAQSGGVTWLFDNERIIEGTPSRLAFDVLIAATDEDTRAGDLLVYINYDPGVFGLAVNGAGKVDVTAADLIADESLYRVHLNDNSASRIAMTVEYLRPDVPVLASELPTSPVKLFSVEMDMEVDGQLADLSFQHALMDAEQFQSDPEERFDIVVASDALNSTPAFGAPDWEVESEEGDESMFVTAVLDIDGDESDKEGDLLSAWVGSEIRGVARPVRISGRNVFFLRVHSSIGAEIVSFRAYDAERDAVLSVTETLSFEAGTTSGSIPSPTELTATEAVQDMALAEGWNLVALALQPESTNPEAIFASLGSSFEMLTGFEGEAVYFDPDGLPFLNTLTSMDVGRGYWLKSSESAGITLSGSPIPNGATVQLSDGWNLLGYWQQVGQSLDKAFSDLIETGALEVVAGFDDGAQLFDPAADLAENSLTELKPGSGYWVKVTQDVDDFQIPEPLPSKTAPTPEAKREWEVSFTNRFMFVSGAFAGLDGATLEGTRVAIRNNHDRLVGEGWLSADGLLPATAVYGDDFSTIEIDGARDGDSLFVELNGQIFALDMTFHDDRQLHRFDLSVDSNVELPEELVLDANYPNPFSDRTTIRFGIREDSRATLVLHDLLGRRVMTLLDSRLENGMHEREFELSSLAAGMYILTLESSGIRKSRSLVKVH